MPKIITIGFETAEVEKLRQAGVLATRGHLGHPYQVDKSNRWIEVRTKPNLPNYAEQEIVVLDMATRVSDSPEYESRESGWQVLQSRGIVDPRSPVVVDRLDDSERILNHGGVFVVFATARLVLDYRESDHQERRLDLWAILPEFNDLVINFDTGEEITSERNRYGVLLAKYLASARFSCTFNESALRSGWEVTGRNKYGQPVALVRPPSEDQKGMFVLQPPLA